jgi:hypothetical protein
VVRAIVVQLGFYLHMQVWFCSSKWQCSSFWFHKKLQSPMLLICVYCMNWSLFHGELVKSGWHRQDIPEFSQTLAKLSCVHKALMAHSFVENWGELVLLLWKQASVFRRAAVMTRPLWFITGFMCFFSIVIALSKVL